MSLTPHQPPRAPRAALLTLAVTVLALKPFALAVSALRYLRRPTTSDVVGLYGADSLVLLACWAALVVPVLLTARSGRPQPGDPVPGVVRWWSTVAGAGLLSLSVFYVLSTFAFWEWGAYLTRAEVTAAVQARATAGLMAYLLDPRPLVAVAALALTFAAVLWAVARASRRGVRRGPLRGLAITCLATGMAALPAWFGDRARDPALASPVLQLLAPVTDHSDGLPPEVPRVDPSGFRLPESGLVAERYRHLGAAAAGMDLIVVVLESVRRDRLALYGCERDTMPNLSRLARHAAVFENAYVNQPRSCKTMASLMLGVYPDPRLRALTWQDERLRGHRSLLGILAGRGHAAYYGIIADRDADNYSRFLSAVCPGGLDRNVGFAELGPSARPSPTTGDDMVLVEDFLAWYGRQAGPAAAVLWMTGAHFPYHAVRKAFPESTLLDRYDNCLYSTDASIGALFEGLARLGRADNALVLLLADHGEALGERAGDTIHGTLFYDHSVRVPCLLVNRRVFPSRLDVPARFQVKDLPATLLFLLGLDGGLRQSVNIFSKGPDDPIYMSNVFQDFKLCKLSGHEKFVFRPRARACYLFDLEEDPSESHNRVSRLSQAEVEARVRDLVQWYSYQIDYLEREFPTARAAR